MATVVNDRDAQILATTPRFSAATDQGLFVTPSSAIFKVSAAGSGSPGSITLTATLLNMTGNVDWSLSWTPSAGKAPVINGNSLTLTYANFEPVSGVITATITVDSQTYTAIATVSKVADGANGVTTYTWIKYATSSTGAGLSDDPAGMTYIGLAYNKSTAVESTLASDYTWSLIKGTDGQPGGKGADGATLYTWIKYSDSADGTSPYDTPTASTQYIGIATNKATATESSVKTDYTWSKFKGDQGVPGTNTITGFLTNEAATIPANAAGTPVSGSFANAAGSFKVFDGIADVSGAAVTYTVFSETNCDVSIGPSGGYFLSGLTADNATAVFQAVYGGVTLQKTLTISRVRAGTDGADAAYVVISAPGQMFTRADSTATFAPTALTLTATPYGGTATFQWQYNNAGTWTNATGTSTNATYTVLSSDFVGARTFRVVATIGGKVYTDQITLVQVTGGKDGAQGIRGTVNISAATSATSWASNNATVNSEATSAIATAGYGAPQARDVVTLYNTNAKFSKTKFWSGTAWTDVAQVLDGNLLVTGSVNAGALAADSVTADNINVDTLAAIVAFLGAAQIGAGGSLRQGQTAYDTGTGFWLGDVGGVPKFSIGQAGGSAMLWNGSNLTLRNPTISSGFNVAVQSSVSGTRSNNATQLGSVALTVTGGLTPYAYSWVVTSEGAPGTVALSSYGSASASVSCNPGGMNTRAKINIAITVTDANGLAITTNVTGSVTWGTPA